MKAPQPKYTRSLAPAGTHVARLYQIIYMGTITGEYKGQPTESFKVRLTWELPSELHSFKEGEPEKPYVVSKEMSLSMGSKSTLRPFVEGMIGTKLSDEEAYGFDIDQLIGMPCILTVAHGENDNGKYVAVTSATGLIKGMECPAQVNPNKILSFDSWDEEMFESLPQFIREKIENTPEYRGMRLKNDPDNEFARLRKANNAKVETKLTQEEIDQIPF